MQNIAIVCNPTAGKGKAHAIRKMAEKALQKLSISYTSFHPPWPSQFKGFTSLWLIGGDGTLHYFLNRYPDIGLPLAIFKGGSGNDFAWKLYGNKTPGDYIESILQATPKKIDAGSCNGKYFINGVGIGFDGAVVKAMGKKKFLPGHLAYLLAVLQQIFFYKEQELTMISGETKNTGKVFMISVANGSRYGGGFLVAPQSLVDDGDLDIVIIRQISPLKRLFHLHKVEKGVHLQLPFIDVLKGKKIIVSSAWPMCAHMDGEFMEADSFTIDILPGRFSFLF